MAKFIYKDTNAEIKVGDKIVVIEPYPYYIERDMVVQKITEKRLTARHINDLTANRGDKYYSLNESIFTKYSNAIIYKYLIEEEDKLEMINSLTNKVL